MRIKKSLPDKLPVRIFILLAGLFFIAFGVALSAKSDLGVSPSSTIPYVVSRAVPESLSGICTVGNMIIALHCVYIIVQIILLNKEYKPIQLCQLALAIAFGKFTDLGISMLSGLVVTSYIARLVLIVLACIFMGIGLFLEVKANLFIMPAEGTISVISEKFHKEFGHLKIAWDFMEIAIGVIISLLSFHTLVGVREGTIIAAFLVGLVVQFCNKHLAIINRWLNGDQEVTMESVASRNSPLVITIEREFGTGGHEIGQMLAEKLGIPFYDQGLIARTADAAGIGVEEVEKNEEKLPLGLIYNLYNQSYAASHNISKQDAIFAAQSKVIRELASKESCVIVGRLGSYVLKGRPNTFNIFIAADRSYRAERIMKQFGVDKKKAMELVKREDQARTSYCHHFTDAPWGLATHYHLSIDSSIYETESSVDLIMDAIDKHQSNVERLHKLYEANYPAGQKAEG